MDRSILILPLFVCIFNWFLITKYTLANLWCILRVEFPIWTRLKIKMHISNMGGLHRPRRCDCDGYRECSYTNVKGMEQLQLQFQLVHTTCTGKQVSCSCNNGIRQNWLLKFSSTYSSILKHCHDTLPNPTKTYVFLENRRQFSPKIRRTYAMAWTMNIHERIGKFARTCNSAPFTHA